MVRIPGGSFVMGSAPDEPGRGDDEGPQRLVVVAPFELGRTEVTRGQWKAVMGADPSIYHCGDDCPVEGVSWDDAVEFLRRLNLQTGRGYRLPSEAEWEYAARAGTRTPFNTGQTISPSQANFSGTAAYNGGPTGEFRATAVPVASFAPNAWGLHDMHGNVWEWVQDCYGGFGQAPPDGDASDHAGCTKRVLRGGSWGNGPRSLRSAHRNPFPPDVPFEFIGFRVARTL